MCISTCLREGTDYLAQQRRAQLMLHHVAPAWPLLAPACIVSASTSSNLCAREWGVITSSSQTVSTRTNPLRKRFAKTLWLLESHTLTGSNRSSRPCTQISNSPQQRLCAAHCERPITSELPLTYLYFIRATPHRCQQAEIRGVPNPCAKASQRPSGIWKVTHLQATL